MQFYDRHFSDYQAYLVTLHSTYTKRYRDTRAERRRNESRDGIG